MDSDFNALKTRRLLLRAAEISDAKAYQAILAQHEVTEFSNIPCDPTLKRCERLMIWMKNLAAKKNGYAWIITKKTSPELIGAIRINSINKTNSYGELGFELSPQFWNMGLMTEAVAAVTDFCHKTVKLNRVEAWVIVGNTASESVLLKNGYLYEGTLKQRIKLREHFHDIKMFSSVNQ